MKAAEVKTSATTAKKSTPFFNKEGNQSFFGQRSADNSFFSKNATQTFIQPKLTVGQPGDKYELEADAMADQVVQRLSQPEALQTKSAENYSPITPAIQPKCAACEQEEKLQKKEEWRGEEEQLQRKPIFESNAPPPEEDIQRKCADCEAEEKVQRKGENRSSPAASSSLERSLASSKGSGSPLPPNTHQQMESSFGADFGNVRIHTGSNAVQMSQALNAQAFTHGSDIYFNSGTYNPESTEGKQLLAHELTHTIQQGGSLVKEKSEEGAIPGKSYTTSTPQVQRAWYNFDIPGTNYQFDPSISGLKTAAGLGVEAVESAGGKVKDAFMWIYNKIKKLINKGIDWLQEKWENLKSFASGGLSVVKTFFKGIVYFLKNPFAMIADAIMNMDADVLQQSWSQLTAFVLNVWDGFHKMGMDLLNKVEKLWDTISGYASKLFNKIDELTGHWAFKKLPSAIQDVVFDLINKLRSLWNSIKSGWESLFKKVKTFVDDAFKTIRDFVKQILSFAIDTIITGIVMFGKALVFIMDFLQNPMQYLQPLAAKIVPYLNGVEGAFAGQVNKYFGEGTIAAEASVGTPAAPVTDTGPTTTGDSADTVIQKKEDTSLKKGSATWSEIGTGVWDVMKKKWEEVKKDPLSIVLNLLLDLANPVIGNVKDIIKLFKDIKKIVTKPFSASSLQDFWTSILRLLDIPILIYNTFWSIVGRTLALPLLIASFIPHPIVKGIAIAAGYALLGALIAGETANISHKLLLLKTGNTDKEEKKDAYNSLSDSLIAFAMEVAMAILILIVSAVAHVIKGVFNFVKGKVFTPKIPSKKPAGKGKVDVEGDKKTDLPDPGKKKTSPEETKSTLENTKGKDGKDLTSEEIKAEMGAFKEGTLKKSADPDYQWEMELPNGHTWKRKKNGKWCRFSTKHCFDEPLPSDKEIYDHLKKEGLITESFEEFMGTKPGGPEPGTDITNEIINGQRTKPKTGDWKSAPNWEKWISNGGKIIKHGDGSVTYMTKDGTWVKYNSKGYPDFSNHLTHPEVKSVDLDSGFDPRRWPDYEKANAKVGKADEWGKGAPEGYTWHHHENGKTMQLVPESIHTLFDHAGGISKL